MTKGSTTMRSVAATAAALAAIGAVASSASGAIRQSTYTVTKIEQSSTVTAARGSYSWNVKAAFRYTARRGSNKIVFDYPTTDLFDGFTKGGTNPRYGVLQGVRAQRATQSGSVTNSSESCTFPGDVPKAERELTVRFYRTGRRAKTDYVEVEGPNALTRIDAEHDDVRVDCLQQMSSLGTVAPKRTLGDSYDVSFPVPRAKFRKSIRSRKKTLVIRGTKRTGLTSNGSPVGRLVVTTKVTMRLIGSR